MKKNNLTGVILCAGKATRISKLPFKKPKMFLEILGKPIIEYQIEYLIKLGIKNYIIVHGKNSGYLKNFVKQKKYSKLNLKLIHDKKPTGIGNSLNKIRRHIKNPFILFLGDIFAINLNIKKMLKSFYKNKSSCEIGCTLEKDKEKIRKNFSIFVKNNKVQKVIEKPQRIQTNIKGIGIYIFTMDVFNSIKKIKNRLNKYKELGITEVIQNLIDSEKTVTSSRCVSYDYNINEPKDLLKINYRQLKKFNKKNYINKSCKIKKNVKIKNSIVGPNVIINENVFIENCIILSNTIIKKNTIFKKKIITENGYFNYA